MVLRHGHGPAGLSPRAGQAGLFIVMNLGLLFGLLALAVDLGWSYFRRQAAQAAADSAALAAAVFAQQNGYTCGSNGVVCGTAVNCPYPNVTPATTVFQVGCLYAEANGFVNNGNQTVTMQGNSTTPPGTSGNAPAYWVKATITETGNNIFARFASIGTFSVQTSALAGVTFVPPTGCIYVLSSSASGATTLTGNSSVTSGCGIWINSSAIGALTLNGGSILHSTQININGGTTSLGNNTVITPTPNNNGGAVSDPLAALPMPTFGSCDYTNYRVGSGSTVTLSPGVYCNGITVTGGSTLNFSPGLYVLNGGGLDVQSSAILSGSGVTFFNTGQSGRSPGPISFGGSSTETFSAPTFGTYQGMLFLQDRNITYGSTNNFTGSSSSSFTGTLYFPSTALKYSGSSSGTFTAIVAKTLTFVGTSNILNDPTGTYTGLGGHSSAIIQ
jgi:Flp pilus assembly protein TadG